MSRRFALAILLLPVFALLISTPAGTLVTVHSKDKPSLTVKVDCAKKQTVSDALAQNQNVQSLIIEISGLCHENVVVTRDRVTLRGTDPATDGIEAADNEEGTDAALWVRGAYNVVIENLKLTGGFSGLLATHVDLPSILLNNCRLEGNAAYGTQLETSLVESHDTTFGPNGNANAGLFTGSRLQCSNCTFADPQGTGPLGLRVNALAFGVSRLLLDHSTLTGGGIQSDNSLVLLSDTTVSQFAPNGGSFSTSSGSSIALTRVQVTGVMRFNQGTNAQLLGVTQTITPGMPPNTADDSAFVRIGDAVPASGPPTPIPSAVFGFTLRNFSNLSLLQTSQLAGNLNCSLGANAFCQTIANVSGTSNCGLCPKP